ncbi:hypothetical protein ACH6EH_07200 [Paenibacillus sp. JSM ZJ436]
MIYDEKEKRYYHKGDCHNGLLKEREVTRRENEQWDALYQYVIKLHDLVVLPTANIVRFQDLRAGYTYKNGEKERQWKTGPGFDLMLEAYKLAEDSIKWCITNKLDNSNDTRSIYYCMGIMINKLNEANENRKLRKERESAKLKTTTLDMQITEPEIKEVKIIKDDMDISSFL